MNDSHAPPNTPIEAFDSLRLLLDAVGAHIFTKDLLGRYTFVNAPMLQLLGRPLEQVVGSSAAQYVTPECAQIISAHDLRVLHLGEELETEEVNWFPQRGEQRVFWTVKRPMRNAHQEIIGLCGVSTDITERKAIEAQLQEQRQLLQAVLNHIDAYVYMKDETRRYRYVNEKVARVWGIAPEQAVGKRDTDLMPPERAELFWQLDQQVFLSNQPQIGEESFVGESGAVEHHWSIKVPIQYDGVRTLIGLSTDISELVRLREQLRLQALSDGLTGLANRRHFRELVDKELARARRHGHPTALMLIDIDHFKLVNDRHGHPTGDAVLAALGELLHAQLRKEDSAARLGGEEFGVLLPRTDLEAARVLAERLRQAVQARQGLLPDGTGLTVSLGVAQTDAQCSSQDALYALADARLYQAKQAGRNCVCAG